jgi:hypothetical protein
VLHSLEETLNVPGHTPVTARVEVEWGGEAVEHNYGGRRGTRPAASARDATEQSREARDDTGPILAPAA